MLYIWRFPDFFCLLLQGRGEKKQSKFWDLPQFFIVFFRVQGRKYKGWLCTVKKPLPLLLDVQNVRVSARLNVMWYVKNKVE